jgi:acetylornithine deacetylase/succinyl-diaminopimelate desuccinylase-like protein
MVELLGALDVSRLTFEPHEILPDLPRLVVGRIEGGQRSSRTAASCRARGDVRLVPGMTAQTVKRDIERVIGELAAADPSFSASVHSLTYQRPFIQPRNAIVVRAVEAAHRAVTGQSPAVGSSLPVQAFATDASHMLRAGIPTVVYGPGVWRTDPDERILVSDLVLAARVYAQAALNVTTAGPAGVE